MAIGRQSVIGLIPIPEPPVHPLQRRFGIVLKRLREASGLSQEALAEAAEIHRNYVGLLERGQRMPTILTVDRLAAALGTTGSRILARVEREKS